VTLSEQTETFLDSLEWLSAIHTPAVAQLRLLAGLIDDTPVPALIAQYGLTYRDLVKQAPDAPEEVDELAKLLKR
jgi:hypothetical protein